MEDLIQRLTNKHVLCKESILDQVDPYTLFCHYSGLALTINQPVLSTVREDDTLPSFCIYYKDEDLRFYDFGRGMGGDVFHFVGERYGLTFNEVLKKINYDFELGYNGILKGTKPVVGKTQKLKPRKTLAVTSKLELSAEGKAFWETFHITEKTLTLYNIREVQTIHVDTNWFNPRSLCFAYYIGQYIKLYYPFNSKGNKFYNNYPRNYVEGYLQLPEKGKLLILTKALKDVMVFKTMGIPSVSPKGENVPIPEHMLRNLEGRFDRIITFFDPDEAGKQGARRYPYPARFLNNGVKDISDYTKAYGLVRTRNLVVQLINSINDYTR